MFDAFFYLKTIEAFFTLRQFTENEKQRKNSCVFNGGLIRFTMIRREETALQGKLDKLAGQIGQLGLAAAAFALISMAGQFTYTEFIVGSSSWDWEYLSTYLHFLITAITIVVSLKYLQLVSIGDDSLSLGMSDLCFLLWLKFSAIAV